MDIISIYMSFISKSAGHFGQKSGLIGHWPADMDLDGATLFTFLTQGEDPHF